MRAGLACHGISEPGDVYSGTPGAACVSCEAGCMQPAAPAQVLLFASSHVHRCSLHEHVCADCGSVSFDGGEHFWLRKCAFSSALLGSVVVCFSWRLLQSAANDIVAGVNWSASWQRQLLLYRDLDWSRAQLGAMQSVYPHFRTAVMDWVDLQNLQYTQELRCTCAVPHQHLSADALTVACKLSRLHLSGSWDERVREPGEPPVAARFGSKHKERLVIGDAGVRKQLRAAAKVGGVSANELANLRSLCSEADLAPLARILDLQASGGVMHASLDPGRLCMLSWAQPFLLELSADGPACAIVNVKDYFLVRLWLDQMQAALRQPNAEAAAQELAIRDGQSTYTARYAVPRLWDCMRQLEGLAAKLENVPLCQAFCALFEQLLQARFDRLLACFSPGFCKELSTSKVV